MTGADILVIGGGIAGAGAAYELAAHAKVILLEREAHCGYHATGRSAASFTENYGTATVRRLAMAGRSFFETPPEGFTEHPLVKPRGMITIARADQIDALDEELAHAQRFLPAMRRMDVEEALSLVPVLRADYLAAAIFEPDSRDIDVHGLHQGYLKALKMRGGVIVTDAEVEAIELSGRHWLVRTRAGDFTGAKLVNAAGAWADDIALKAGAESIGLTPKRRTAFTIDAPAGVAIADWPLVNDVGAAFYFKPDAGQLLVSPADTAPSPPCDAQADEYELALGIDRLERATSIPVRKINRKWAGLRTFASDGNPVVGEDPLIRGFFWLAGQGGYGFKTAPALSRIIAALILTGALPAEATARGLTAEEMSPGRFSALVEPQN
ncbi:MAG TPA: FAD-binding oxidoreductase [Verrucomicrobiae bacterium]|nr:FAD-binding oxidoreductase [Verrucomicrobiae bacterium]